MIPALPERGLYAITPDGLSLKQLLANTAQAAASGMAVLQYRDKAASRAEALLTARELAALCHRSGVPLIVNDDLDLALASGAAGVHLGRDELDQLERARAVRPRLVVGVSCYNSLERAEAAVAAGADYVAFGSFFPSSTKPGAIRCELETLRLARRRLDVPIVAIGGISPENGAALVAAGAHYLAAITGVFAQHDVGAATAAYVKIFKQGHPHSAPQEST
jgi:thiamine-phosphate pyrophosphorylase